MPHLQLRSKKDLSSFRRIAIGTWKTAYDPSVYGMTTLSMDESLRYIEAFRKKTGKRLTITHMLAKASGAMLEQNPDANAILRFNRIYLRKRIGVFFQVAMEDPDTGEVDLSGCTIHDPEKKSLLEIVDEFTESTRKVREYEDEELEKTRSTFKKIPFFLLNFVMNLLGLLLYTFNLDLTKLGLPRDPFGSLMITNIGSLKLDRAYVPLVPYSRVPLLIAAGAVREAAVVREGKLAVGRVMDLCATFDHRVLDGMHAAKMVKVLRAWLEHPFDHFDALDGEAPADPSAAGAAPGTGGTPKPEPAAEPAPAPKEAVATATADPSTEDGGSPATA